MDLGYSETEEGAEKVQLVDLAVAKVAATVRSGVEAARVTPKEAERVRWRAGVRVRWKEALRVRRMAVAEAVRRVAVMG